MVAVIPVKSTSIAEHKISASAPVLCVAFAQTKGINVIFTDDPSSRRGKPLKMDPLTLVDAPP